MIGYLGFIGDLCESLPFPVRHTERILGRFTIGRIRGEGWWSFDGITEFSELTEWGGGRRRPKFRTEDCRGPKGSRNKILCSPLQPSVRNFSLPLSPICSCFPLVPKLENEGKPEGGTAAGTAAATCCCGCRARTNGLAYWAVKPPSMERSVPVMKEAPGELR